VTTKCVYVCWGIVPKINEYTKYVSKGSIMKICPKCNIEFDPGKWNKAFCSRKCSNSRAFTSETNKKRSLANSRAYQRLSDDKKKEMIEKRLSTYRNHTPANLCICCKSLINKNKHNMCWECYIKSDISLEARGHHFKNYKRLSVIDSNGDSVRLMSSMEIQYYEYLEKNSIKWKKPESIKYTDPLGKNHWYKPDFHLIDTDEIIEIKGHWWNNDKLKMKWVIEQNPSLEIKIIMKNDLINLIRE